MTEQDRQISAIFAEQRSRLRNFIRRRVPDPRDAEDILQDAFYKLVEANRVLMPIEHVTEWLFHVARNRITDLFRKKKPASFSELEALNEEETLHFEDLLPSPDARPEALYARKVLLGELELAVAELPPEQREVWVAHELEGRSLAEMAVQTGVCVNTLLARKRYAVLHLRRRLQALYDEFTKSMRQQKMTRREKMFFIIPLAMLGIAAFIFLGGWIVMSRWNWLLPPLFGWKTLAFSQALGILLLCRILFGGWGQHGGGHRRSELRRRIVDRMADNVGDRWERMTPGERERFRQRVRERCGFDPGTSEGGAPSSPRAE